MILVHTQYENIIARLQTTLITQKYTKRWSWLLQVLWDTLLSFGEKTFFLAHTFF